MILCPTDRCVLSAGADIKNVVNQAALRAAADLVEAVSMKHLEAARDKVLMGELGEEWP